MLVIHAPNVHQGGGFFLLNALLKALHGKAEFLLCADERMSVPAGISDDIPIKRVKPSIVQRICAERWLAKCVGREDIVLCFGNLPPLCKLRGHTVVFVQNRYLVDAAKLSNFPIRIRVRLAIERLWLFCRMSNANEFIVQTPTMKRLLTIRTQGKVPVRVLPFVADSTRYTRSPLEAELEKSSNPNFDFVYVASGEPHKNHRKLIEAWCLLAEEGHFPSLCLTLDKARFPQLCREIEIMQQRYDLKVTNVGELAHQEVLALYKRSSASIYPSTFESFGLPLIEARQANLPVLASELDYVRDVLDPEQTFDPESSMSIFRAVKRFIGADEQPLLLLNATQFVAAILGKVE